MHTVKVHQKNSIIIIFLVQNNLIQRYHLTPCKIADIIKLKALYKLTLTKTFCKKTILRAGIIGLYE